MLQRPKKKRLVNRPISRSKASATKALTKPIKTASAEMGITRGVQVKSPSLAGPPVSPDDVLPGDVSPEGGIVLNF